MLLQQENSMENINKLQLIDIARIYWQITKEIQKDYIIYAI